MSQTENFEEKRKKIQDFEEKLRNLIKISGVEPIPSIEFPQFRELPVEVLLALKILEKNEYKIMITYEIK